MTDPADNWIDSDSDLGIIGGDNAQDASPATVPVDTRAGGTERGQAQPRVAASTVIAEALIRSMFGSRSAPIKTTSIKPTPDSKGVTTSPLSKTAATEEPTAARSSLPMMTPIAVPFELAIEKASADFALSDSISSSRSSGEAGSPTGSKDPQGAASVRPAGSPVSQAPIAFTARLTPLEETQSIPEMQSGAMDSAQTPSIPLNEQLALGAEGKNKQPLAPAPASHNDVSGDPRGSASSEIAAPRTTAVEADGNFARAFENAAQTDVSPAGPDVPKPASIFGTVADALRAPEPATPPASLTAASLPNSSPVQEITMRIARPELAPVDLRVTEQAGEIHVAVRTPDAGFQSSLRQDLGALTNSLERAGYRAETFVPREAAASAIGLLNNAASSNMSSRDDRHEQPGSSGGHSGDSNNQRQQQQRQRQRDPGYSSWLNEMERQQ